MDDFERRMEALKARFVERAAADQTALTAAWAARDNDAVRLISHSLAGNAGIFGYPDLGDAARELEEALDQLSSDEHLQQKLDAVLTKIHCVRAV